jgi:hypothetical protein
MGPIQDSEVLGKRRASIEHKIHGLKHDYPTPPKFGFPPPYAIPKAPFQPPAIQKHYPVQRFVGLADYLRTTQFNFGIQSLLVTYV